MDDASQRATRLLVLGAGPSQLGLLEAARARDLFVIAADRDPRAPAFPLADRRALISVVDEPALERLASAEQVDAVIAPGIEWPVAIAARIAARLGLPHPIAPESAQVATSRLRERERFAGAGLPQPDHVVVSKLEEAHEAAGALGYPIVVRASDPLDRHELVLAREPSELEAAVAGALEGSRTALCLIERPPAGRELTVSGFSLGGEFCAVLTSEDERAAAPAFGVGLGHCAPAQLTADEERAAVELAARAVEALGIAEGPTTTHLVLTDRGPVLIGVAARLGGEHDAELARAARGVDLNALALAAALGETIEPTDLVPEHERHACTRFLVAPPGELIAVHGLDEAAAAEGVEAVRVYRQPGFVFGPLRRSSDRAGVVLATGATAAEAHDRAAAAADLLRFETADGSGKA